MTTDIPSGDDLIGRARALIPALAARARQGEAERRIPADTIAEMQEAGLFRILQPKRWGGYELDPGTFFEVQMALGEGDMSTGWVYGVVGLHPWQMALFDDRAAQEVWGADQSTLICSSLMPSGKAEPVAGGFRLSGHWRFASGCDHCRWALLGAVPVSPQAVPPDTRLFLVPRQDYRIVDTWRVAGLKATGSQDIQVKDVFVPDYRSQRMIDNFNGIGAGLMHNTATLYRYPFGQIFVRGVSSAAIGALKAMLDGFIAYAGRPSRLTGGRTADDPTAQLVCAEIAAAIDEMKAVLHKNFAVLLACAERGEMPPLPLRQQFKFQSSFVAERCAALAARLFRTTGGAGLSDDLPFGRLLADINAGRQHITNQYEAVGRNWGATLLGVGTNKDLML